MRLFIYGLNFSPELTGVGKYSGDMAYFFAAIGIATKVVTTPPYYPEWRVHDGFKSYSYDKETFPNLSVYRCPFYVPNKPTTFKRLVHLFSHALTSFPVLFWLALTKRPDVIFTVQPTAFAAPFAWLAARLCGAKCVMHIQDYELDAMLGLGMAKHGRLIGLLRKCETWLMRRFDRVSTISYSMIENARRKGVDEERLLFFPNWADTDFVSPDVDGSSLRASWGYSESDVLVLYSGNIGKKQGLEVVLQAAQAFNDRPDVKFLLVGSGAHVDTLVAQATALGLANLAFKPIQAWELVPQMLTAADIHLVVQKKGAADAVLPSKLTNILSVGGDALVTAEADTELGQIEAKYPGIYTRVEPEDELAFIDALKRMVAQARVKNEHNHVARQYAEENLNRETVLKRFYKDLENLCRDLR